MTTFNLFCLDSTYTIITCTVRNPVRVWKDS